MLTPAQLEARLNYVTGSDASIICGLNPYTNVVELYLQKTRQSNAKDISCNPYVRAGNYLEGAIAKWFEDETGLKTTEVDDMLIHPEYYWMSGNLDRRIEGRPKEILEIKTASNSDAWGKDGDDTTIPDHYLLQCAHYCAVADAEICWIAVLFRGVDFRIYRYDRNLTLEKKLIEKEKYFWEENVMKSVCPNPTTAQEVRSMQYEIIGDFSIATPEVEQAVFKCKEIKNSIKQLEDSLEEYKGIICAYMLDKDTLLDGFGKPLATWKQSKPTNRFDTKRFRDECEEEYKKYCYESSPTRPLIIKG